MRARLIGEPSSFFVRLRGDLRARCVKNLQLGMVARK